MPNAKLSDESPTPTARGRSESNGVQSTANGVSARRLKKREIDRRCQRQARERTKSRIAYLESLVENLKQPDGDDRSAALMRRLEETEKERDGLAQTLRDVQKALGTYEAIEEKAEPSDNSPDVKDISLANDTGDVEAFNEERTDSYDSTLIPEHRQPPIQPGRALIDTPVPMYAQYPITTEPIESTGERPDEPIVPKVCNDGCDCCRDAQHSANGQPGNLWRYANTTLLEPYRGPSQILPEEDLLADDIPVRVVLEGWDAVEQQIELTVSWKILRGIDETLFAKCGPVNRLAVLTTMHMLLQYHREPTPERGANIPPWYLRRPSSQTQKHSYAINFFVWPGLRERFVFYQHHYCANIFWQLFSASLYVNWPYDFRDCFAQRWDSGAYEISPLFRTCISEIGNWQMRGDLFERFPELRCDIPATVLTARPISNMLQMQMANVDPYVQARTKRLKQQERRHTAAVDSWDVQSSNLFPFGAPDNASATPWMNTPWIS